MTASPTTTDWNTDHLDDLAGKRYLITGGNSGIGFEAASHLRRANADVLITCRSAAKGADAAASLNKIPSTGAVKLTELDLASLDSILT